MDSLAELIANLLSALGGFLESLGAAKAASGRKRD
jgi:hypothetical protein